MKIKKNTWLPIFKGFYGTDYQNDDSLLYRCFDVSFNDLIEPIKDFLSYEFHDNIDYNGFNVDFLKSYCRQLSDDNIRFTYESISSPKYYNYSNDSCNVIVEIKDWNIIKKFIYDLWGDTVNVASRMESHGEPGEIQITQATYEYLAKTNLFIFAPRGKITIKGKGEMTTYWLKGKKGE
jgi:hypothetical protein